MSVRPLPVSELHQQYDCKHDSSMFSTLTFSEVRILADHDSDSYHTSDSFRILLIEDCLRVGSILENTFDDIGISERSALVGGTLPGHFSGVSRVFRRKCRRGQGLGFFRGWRAVCSAFTPGSGLQNSILPRQQPSVMDDLARGKIEFCKPDPSPVGLYRWPKGERSASHPGAEGGWHGIVSTDSGVSPNRREGRAFSCSRTAA